MLHQMTGFEYTKMSISQVAHSSMGEKNKSLRQKYAG